jgi:hypothetical protein
VGEAVICGKIDGVNHRERAMSPSFKPKAYLLVGCPFCLKFLMFMSEARLADGMEIIRIDPQTPDFERIKTQLADATKAKPTFPTVQTEPDVYRSDSDQLIEYYSQKHEISTDSLPALKMYKEGVLPNLMKLYKENTELKQKLSA